MGEMEKSFDDDLEMVCPNCGESRWLTYSGGDDVGPEDSEVKWNWTCMNDKGFEMEGCEYEFSTVRKLGPVAIVPIAPEDRVSGKPE